MADLKEIVETLDALTIDESEQLVDILKEAWGVTLPDPVDPSKFLPNGPEVTAKTEFDVELTSFDASKKIKVIQAVRGILGTPLRDTKEIVEKAPVILKEGTSETDAQELQRILEDAGAKVTLK